MNSLTRVDQQVSGRLKSPTIRHGVLEERSMAITVDGALQKWPHLTSHNYTYIIIRIDWYFRPMLELNWCRL